MHLVMCSVSVLGAGSSWGSGHRQSDLSGQPWAEQCQDGYVDPCSHLVHCSLPADNHALSLILYWDSRFLGLGPPSWTVFCSISSTAMLWSLTFCWEMSGVARLYHWMVTQHRLRGRGEGEEFENIDVTGPPPAPFLRFCFHSSSLIKTLI